LYENAIAPDERAIGHGEYNARRAKEGEHETIDSETVLCVPADLTR
jgi:hypothetical protein